MIQILSIAQNIPNTVNIGQLKSSIDNLSIEDRIIEDPDGNEVKYIAFTDENGISLIPSNPDVIADPKLYTSRWNNSGGYDQYNSNPQTNTFYEKYYA